MDGRTELTKGILKQYVWAYGDYQQDKWNELFAIAEFAYNNSYQETIKWRYFYANYKINLKHQVIIHMITENIISATGMKELQDTLLAEMAMAQLQDKENHDHHREPNLKIKRGDIAWLLPRNPKTTRPFINLDWKKIGLFKKTTKIDLNAYKLDLPPWMRIHNIFHICLLKPWEYNKFPSHAQEPYSPVQMKEEDEYQLYEIMDSEPYSNKV